MDITLGPLEIRVLGSLLEKSITTPDYYPLSLAAVTAACNQRSNREPVMNIEEGVVSDTLASLITKHLARERSPSGSRVSKYGHRLADSLGLSFDFSAQELGILCVLMLRGPQTSGEIRARTTRLCKFSDLAEVERVLHGLASHGKGPYVKALPREAGRRENRFMHLFGAKSELDEGFATLSEEAGLASPMSTIDRISQLERVVAQIRTELDELRARLED